jgi:MFS family permease
VHGLWPLLLIAFIGTLNPSGGDVSVFLPLEHTVVAHTVPDRDRTAMFARYSFAGAVLGALGALAAGIVDWFAPAIPPRTTINLLFILYGLIGLLAFVLYRGLSPAIEVGDGNPPAPLGPSRRRVYGLAALFSVGGLVVNALLALWLYERFGLSISTTGAIFFATKLCSAVSYFLAVPLARRFGLVNTMVFTHLPANIFLALTAFAPSIEMAFVLLILRGLLSEMDVPTRSSYVMAVVLPEERPAAASVTAVPRSLAAALAPLLSGWLFTLSPFGWPLVLAGTVKATVEKRPLIAPFESSLRGEHWSRINISALCAPESFSTISAHFRRSRCLMLRPKVDVRWPAQTHGAEPPAASDGVATPP